MVSRSAALAALAALLPAAPALADRAGDAPIKAPSRLATHHIAFTLPGDIWNQEVGVIGGPSSFGHYRRTTTLAGGGQCTLTATVIATTSRRPPVVTRTTVRLSSTDILSFTSSGRHGAVRWWAGRRKGYDSAAIGLQRLPARLASRNRRHLTYRVTIQHFAEPANPNAGFRECQALARETRNRVAATMHIAGGPPLSEPPYIG